MAKGVLCAETAEARLILSWAVGDRAWTDAQLCGSARNWRERWRSALWSGEFTHSSLCCTQQGGHSKAVAALN